ncbi:MAG: hypothetical protein ACOY5Y_05605 [Pseudomonadota bacterium]|jgi:hypothetical protein
MAESSVNGRALSLSRVALAFAVAPAVPALAYASLTLFDGIDNGSFWRTAALFALLGGYPAALVLGVPVFLLLRGRLAPRLIYAVVAGGLVAAAPWTISLLPDEAAHYASVDGRATVVRGVRTAWGWIVSLQFLAMTFALGALGGAAFWWIAAWKPRREP